MSRRTVTTLLVVLLLVPVGAVQVGAATGGAVPAAPAVAGAAPLPAAPRVVSQDVGAFLWGLVLQGLASGLLGAAEGLMNSAIEQGPGSLFWYQVGRSLWDVGCEWGRAGEALTPGLPPTFPFRCTLVPTWPY